VRQPGRCRLFQTDPPPKLPQGTLFGLNDFKKTEYGGPCPPIGRHRYFHKLYALDVMLDLRGATKSKIERAMRGHVLANALAAFSGKLLVSVGML
jgi:Raf kinase inhibitor-like YbhB/YbcL family protein